MTDPSQIFCCPSDLLETVQTYRSPKECMLWYFTCCTSNLNSGPPTPISLPPPSTASSSLTPPITPAFPSTPTSPPEEIPKGFLAAVLSESPFAVQFERWFEGEREEVRWFIPHPSRGCAFLELPREVVKGPAKGQGDRKERWEWGWAYIKMRCEHAQVLFVIKFLERVVGRERREAFGFRRGRRYEADDEDEDDGWREEGEEKSKDEDGNDDDADSCQVEMDKEMDGLEVEGTEASFRGEDEYSGGICR